MTEQRKTKGRRQPDWFEQKRRKGWNVGLYRNTQEAKLAGVCAGVADYVEIDRGMLRLIFLASVLLSSGTSLVIYALGWLLLSPAPELPTEVERATD